MVGKVLKGVADGEEEGMEVRKAKATCRIFV